MTFTVSGDIRTRFGAFMYSICILVSIFSNGRSALKEVCSITVLQTHLVFCFWNILPVLENIAGACSQEKLKYGSYDENVFDLSKWG